MPRSFGLLSENATDEETDKECFSHIVLETGKVKVKMPGDTVSGEDWVILLLKLLGSEAGPWQPQQTGLSLPSSIGPIKETNKLRAEKGDLFRVATLEEDKELRGHSALGPSWAIIGYLSPGYLGLSRRLEASLSESVVLPTLPL